MYYLKKHSKYEKEKMDGNVISVLISSAMSFPRNFGMGKKDRTT